MTSKIIGDTSCPSCKKQGRDSKDNHLMLFDDGGAFCNRCGHTENKGTITEGKLTEIKLKKDSKPKESMSSIRPYMQEMSVFSGIPSRSLQLHACKHFGVRVGLSQENGKEPVCVYTPIIGEAGVQGYKVKTLVGDKRLWIKGDGKNAELFGSDVVPKKGNKLFITEGELDAVALYQALYEHTEDKWKSRISVVSLPNGSGCAASIITKSKKLIDGYKEIVLVFDQDKAGEEAVEAVLTVLPKDKVTVATFEKNDPNDMVKAGLSRELYFSCIQANKPRPEKILTGSDISLEALRTPLKAGIMTPYPGLNNKLRGLRRGPAAGELTVWCAGTGMGKTTIAREIMYDLNNKHECRLGHIFLEEQESKTAQAYIAMDNNIPLGALRADPKLLDQDRFEASYNRLIDNNRCFFMKHWGSMDSAELMDHMWYFSKVCKSDFIFLDHISLVVSGGQSSSEGERKDLDVLMTKLAAFCEESGTSVQAIVHLKRPAHGSYNNGGKITLSHLRGSAAIEQLSHNIIAIEGDQHGSNPNSRTIRILKNREWGDIGVCDSLVYNPETGRLLTEGLT